MRPPAGSMRHPAGTLRAIKVLHTVVWAFFAACIVSIPVAVSQGNLHVATWLVAIVLLEVVTLAANHFRCPLTDLAGRYTVDRTDNFDIYLPLWLARFNKVIFGFLFALGVVLTVVRWWNPTGH